MDPVTGSIVGSVASSLLGGLFGGGGGSKAEWVTPDYADIRRKAEAAGFNPLTALQNASGGVGTSTTAPSFGQRLANGAADAFSAYSEGKILQTELDQRERELQIKEKAAEALSQQERHTSGLVQKQATDQKIVNLQELQQSGAEGTSESGVTYFQPQKIGGKLEASTVTPTAIMNLHDNLLQGNPDNPPEFEVDFYAAAREGKLPQFATKLVRKNNFLDPYWWGDAMKPIAEPVYDYLNDPKAKKPIDRQGGPAAFNGNMQLATPSMMMGGVN